MVNDEQQADDQGTLTDPTPVPAMRRDYEAAVRALRERREGLYSAGVCAEVVARTVHAERRVIATRFKEMTPEPLRSALYERTLRVYGDRLGPSIDYLRAKGKSWEDIAEGATTPGQLPKVNFHKKTETR